MGTLVVLTGSFGTVGMAQGVQAPAVASRNRGHTVLLLAGTECLRMQGDRGGKRAPQGLLNLDFLASTFSSRCFLESWVREQELYCVLAGRGQGHTQGLGSRTAGLDPAQGLKS